MEKEIIVQGEIDTSYGIGYFPVTLKLLIDEKGNIKDWSWMNITRAGKEIWTKPDARAKLRVCKQLILDHVQPLMA